MGFQNGPEISFASTEAYLPASIIPDKRGNNDQIPCDVTRCGEVTLSNVGNALLLIDSIAWMNGTGFQITSSVPTPFTIAPNSQRVIQVCLVGNSVGLRRDTLMVSSNTRNSLAVGIVIDISGSMETAMQCGSVPSTRMEQAIIQANDFIKRTLLHLPTIGVQDQLAICSYSSNNLGAERKINFIFPLTSITDPTRLIAQTRVAALRPDGGTPTGAAVTRMIDTLSKSPLRNRVIVLLNDGNAEMLDQLQYPLTSVIALAKARGIRVFTIGVGMVPNSGGIQYLRELATQTQGAAFDASDGDCKELQSAFESITDSVSRGTKLFEPFALKIIAPSVVASGDIHFDSLYVHETTCSTLVLSNIGEGEAIVDSIGISDMLGGPTTEFYLKSGFTLPIRIPEDGNIAIPICFTPGTIRTHGGRVVFRYNSCGQVLQGRGLSGAAYAIANLRINDTLVGLPGSIVTMPVYIDSVLTEYGVNTIRYQVRWNKSMLDLRTVRSGAESSGGAVSVGAVTYDNRYATVDITFNGTMRRPGEVAELEFMVLRGDTLVTPVELTAGSFEDGNPKKIISNGGLVSFDSTCFRQWKPISNAGVAKIVAGEVSPTPALGHEATILLTSAFPSSVSVELYSTDGRMMRDFANHGLAAGTNEVHLDISGLAPGTYYALLHAGTGETIVRKVLVVR